MDVKEAAEADAYKKVRVVTTDTAEALYIEPLHALNLDRDGRVTLQYALLGAVAELYEAEESELRAVLVGDEANPNILLYENAQGSLGILSQIISDPDALGRIAERAWAICRFDDAEYLLKASYDDLLSYYNQRDHLFIDRWKIKDALELVKTLRGEVLSVSGDYEQRYQDLSERIDHSSTTERKFLDTLRAKGLRLPDAAQYTVSDCYVRPDFYYGNKIAIFCDGTPHDADWVAERDESKRDALREKGWQVLVWRYNQDLDEWLAKRPDIFKKVKS